MHILDFLSVYLYLVDVSGANPTTYFKRAVVSVATAAADDDDAVHEPRRDLIYNT
jgi:hypothetical protein